MKLRTARSVIVWLLLTGCAGQPPSLGDAQTTAPKIQTVDMTGRWKLATPNAPSCGMHFESAPGGNEGTIAPEGGCPGQFFTSRHWTFSAGRLTIINHEQAPLAQLKLSHGQFAGTSAAGTPVTLSRYPSQTS